jgi:hypothetical protein
VIASAAMRNAQGVGFALESARSRAAFTIVRPWRSFIHGRIDQLPGFMAADGEGVLRMDIPPTPRQSR